MTIQTLREKYPKLTEEQIADIREYAKTVAKDTSAFMYDVDEERAIRLAISDNETNPVSENQTNLFEDADKI